MSASLSPAVEKVNRMLGLNAVLSRLSKADCSRVFFVFLDTDAEDEGLEGADSELASLLDFAFDASPLVFSFECAGMVFVTTGLAIEDDVARLPLLAHPAPGGKAEPSALGLPGVVS